MKLRLTEENRKWWVLAAMTTTISVIFIDITVLPVALPTMQRDMHITDLGLQWIINSYTLVLAVLALAGGKMADRVGLKRGFCIGILTFALASAMCGLSTAQWWLIMSRAIQGVGGAILLPATQGIIISQFPPHQRGKAMGLYVSIGSIFLALGSLIGGALTTYLTWRYVFWINLPITAIGLMLTFYAVPPMQGRKERFDTSGFCILTVGLASLVFALMQAQIWGWSSPFTLGLMVLGCAALYYLFHRKHHPKASILDFELMGKKSFISSASCIFSNQFIIMVTVFWAIYFQNILGFSASKAGFYAFLANIPVLFAAPLGGWMVDRFGPRMPIMTGFGLITFALSWLIAFLREESLMLLMPTLITFGFGVTMIFTPSFVSMMNDVPADKRGNASGIISTLRQFSSSLGLALFGTIDSIIYLTHMKHFFVENPGTQHLSPEPFEGLLAKAPNAVKAMNALPSGNSSYVLEAARVSFLDAFFWINCIAALIALSAIALAWKMMRNTPIHHPKV